jgi:predicted  nucleic acid-binding Zn-ribbon protein
MNQTLITILQLDKASHYAGGRRAQSKTVVGLRATLSPKVLRQFDYLLMRERGPIAVISEAETCGNCHLKLPHGALIAFRGAPDEIHNCPYCGCFLCTIDHVHTGVAMARVKDSGKARLAA